MFRRGKRVKRIEALWTSEWDELARYNGEVARGLLHRPEKVARMQRLQHRYHTEYLPAVERIREEEPSST